MENPFAPTKQSNSRKLFSSVAGHEEETEANSYPAGHDHVSVEITKEEEERRSQLRPILYRVPPQLRENKKHIYEPVFLPLGPYHDHSKSQFRQVEEFKDEILNDYIYTFSVSDKGKDFFIRKILWRIDEIRMFYGGVSLNDEALAEMMLRDGLFVLYYMEMAIEDSGKAEHFYRWLGMFAGLFLYRDMLMLENQIPFWLIKMLITLTYDDRVEQGEALVYKFLSWMSFEDPHKLNRRVPWEFGEEKEEEPLHLLEAHRRILLLEEADAPNSTINQATKVHRTVFEFRHRLLMRWKSFLTKYGWRKSSRNSSSFEKKNSPFRSVTDLKAKGIHFAPSSYCLNDIRFDSYWFYGELHLPIRYVSRTIEVSFSNIIAFEMSPKTGASTNGVMLSYVNFMKSLINKPEDVKELREKGIIFSSLRNDDEVMKLFKGIDTFGTDNIDIFQDVKRRIDKHCKSKAKTWMAELTYTYFRSPWTVIALFAATFLLCLTFLQTYYSINPPN